MAAARPPATARTERQLLTRRQLYEQTKSALYLERSSFESVWRECAEQIAPRRIRLTTTDRNRGDRRTQAIIDSEPRFAARTLQFGLHAGITSPARPWFRLTTPDPELAERESVKQWLHDVTERIHTVFLRSNLYNALPIVYGDLGVFGTAAMAVLEDDHDALRAYAYPIGSYAFGLDARGVANTFVREYRMTVAQLIDQFGRVNGSPRDIDWTKFSTTVKSLYDAGHDQATVDVCWYVGPNEQYDRTRLESRYALPWTSCYFELGRQSTDFADPTTFLRESGFRQFPMLCPRWDVTGEDTYGTDCPGLVALGDAKQLQFMQRKKAKAIDKAIDPPLKAPPNLLNQKISLLPGDVTHTDERDAGKSLAPIHEVRLEGLREIVQDMSETRYRIDRAFFADLFLMLANSDYGRQGGQPVTAREIEERHEEKLLALGPVLERLNDELLDPLIDRTFDILFAAGAIPPPPPELEGLTLKVEYISALAQAQKLIAVAGQERFLGTVANFSQAFPEMRHKVDVFEWVDGFGDGLGINPKFIRSTEDAQARLEAEQQAVARAQQAEQLRHLGAAAQSLGRTPTQGGTSTALDDATAAGGLA